MAFKLAAASRSSRASLHIRPPVSVAATTMCIVELANSSGYALCLLLRARPKLMPGLFAASAHAVPSACSGDTMVASTAMGKPRPKGSPDATISMRLPSAGSIPGPAVSRRKTFSLTLLLASRRTRAHVFSNGPDRSSIRPEFWQDAARYPLGSRSLRHPWQHRPPHSGQNPS